MTVLRTGTYPGVSLNARGRLGGAARHFWGGEEEEEDGRDSAARITARNDRLPGRPAAVVQYTPIAAILESCSGEPVARWVRSIFSQSVHAESVGLGGAPRARQECQERRVRAGRVSAQKRRWKATGLSPAIA